MSDTPPLTKETRQRRKEKLRYDQVPTWDDSPKWAWFWEAIMSDLDQSQTLVALVLWGFSNSEFGPVFPSISTIATLVGLHERSIKRHVKELDKKGFVSRVMGGGSLSTRYQLKLPDDVMKENISAPRRPSVPKFSAEDKGNKKKYYMYLFSKEWKARRTLVLSRDNYKCTSCGKKAHSIHHLTYKNIFNEPLEDLTSLCKSCHEKVHGIAEAVDVAEMA